MSAVGQFRTGSLWSLGDMLEVNGQAFMDAVMEVRRIQAVIDHAGTAEDRKHSIDRAARDNLLIHVRVLLESIGQLYANVTGIAVDRLRAWLESDEEFTWESLRAMESDIESRLRDELGLIRFFALSQQEAIYLKSGVDLLGEKIVNRFPSAIFEMEESSKCVALARPTAAAFHAMRALEVAIRALAAFLEIPDPTKPVERNWGVILSAIKERIDAKYSAKMRMPGSVGAMVEVVYVSLDAVKNPWRNATMHAEATYQPHEAFHILQCVNSLFLKLADICDETGTPV